MLGLQAKYFLFQFHNGTINTAYLIKDILANKTFQFHNGTINTPDLFTNVNSLMDVSIPQWYDKHMDQV